MEALRSDGSPHLWAWVRIPLLTTCFYYLKGLEAIFLGSYDHFKFIIITLAIEFSYRLTEPNNTKEVDEDGIRTHAGRAHWISSPTP